jgi:hypothetical protein
LAVVLFYCSVWSIFTKASQPGWAALIPGYSTWIQLKIVGRPTWWIYLNFLPGPDALLYLWCIFVRPFDFAKAYGKSRRFGLGLMLCPFVFVPILAYGDALYVGPGGDGSFGRKRLRKTFLCFEDEYQERAKKRLFDPEEDKAWRNHDP